MLNSPICLFGRRYNILGALIVARAKTDKIGAKGLFEKIGLEPEKYRLGHTKASPSSCDCDLCRVGNFVPRSYVVICNSGFRFQAAFFLVYHYASGTPIRGAIAISRIYCTHTL